MADDPLADFDEDDSHGDASFLNAQSTNGVRLLNLLCDFTL